MNKTQETTLKVSLTVIFIGIIAAGFIKTNEESHNRRHQEANLTIESLEYRLNSLTKRCR